MERRVLLSADLAPVLEPPEEHEADAPLLLVDEAQGTGIETGYDDAATDVSVVTRHELVVVAPGPRDEEDRPNPFEFLEKVQY